MQLPESSLLDSLVCKNHLDRCGFFRFVFFDGMLFGSDQKWWGKKGRRRFPHEGLDLCFFEDHRGNSFRLDASVTVPMLYDGQVEHITDDFLGKTVISSHVIDARVFGDNDRAGTGKISVLSLYGHLRLDKELRIGDAIKQDEIFASIAAIDNPKKKLLPHLHISLARPEMLPPAHQIEWALLNTADRSVFMNPFDALRPAYRVTAYDEALNLSQKYVPCSQITAPGLFYLKPSTVY